MEWTALQTDLLQRVAAFSERPIDVTRLELCCCAWRAAMEDSQVQEALWHHLCVLRFPTMAARIKAAPGSGADKRCQDGCVCSQEQRLESSSAALSPPRCPVSEPSELCGISGSAAGWKEVYHRRWMRQQQWDANKPRRRVDSHNSLDMDHPVSLATTGSSSRGARTRTCKRCGLDFDPRERDQQAVCRWHTGRFVAMDANGSVLESSAYGGAVSKSRDRRAQNLIKAQNRKKTSKRAHSIVFALPGSSGVEREDGISWRWSCCELDNLLAPGCACGRHQ
eukprot:TRINITY_DN66165_c0_g1_i1.p1 TRINITY_DN66165_c0_g1~~TRINITY_DN66165_c0_g1_i1.p1  ORF type:complete len:298 (+),score=41.24 TRINITY_DN66165_c0_g1_i1:55-894(+)